jgi:uncharacterized protein (DUF1800 family)
MPGLRAQVIQDAGWRTIMVRRAASVLTCVLLVQSCAAQAPTAVSPDAQSVAKPSAPLVSIDRPMGEPVARAMLGRFGYGPTVGDIRRVAALSLREYVDAGIRGSSELPAPIAVRIAAMPAAGPLLPIWEIYGVGGSAREAVRDDPERRKQIERQEREYLQDAVQARLLAMANSPNQAHEALLSFWLNHFSIFGPKNLDKLLAFDYARHIEAAMKDDSFEALLRASFRHPAMQFFLDNAQSTAPTSEVARSAALATNGGRNMGINENLARELLELHTLGVDGGYTQTDIQELARIITGAGAWSPRMVDRNLERAGATRDGVFLFDPRRHDHGAKNLLGEVFPATDTRGGMSEIDRALGLLARHPATARHISRKLALRFLSDNPSDATIAAMSAAYRSSGGRISAVLNAMMGTAEFTQSLAERAKFREPLDQLLATARAACQDQTIGNAELLGATAVDTGQAPFMRSTPDGYGAREADWFSPAALAKRVRFAIGVATERAPLATGSDMASGTPRMRAGEGEGGRPRFLEGTSCRPDAAAIAATLGPLSPATTAAIQNLGPRERVAVLLASPEALRR